MVSPNESAYLAHAVATLGAASRSLTRIEEFAIIAKEIERYHGELAKVLKEIRGEEARARETKQS